MRLGLLGTHLGSAWQLEPSSSVPYIGGLVLLNEGIYGHIAYIEAVYSDSILISEANYIPCQESQRTISIDYPAIRGYK